jgi:cysteinyl-tRNA synthetase
MEMGRSHLAQAADALDRLDSLARRARVELGPDAGGRDAELEAAFDAALDDDFNTPAAMAALFEGVRRAHVAMNEGRAAEASALATTVRALAAALGLELDDGSGDDDTEITALVTQRDAARRDRDFAEADRIRAELAARGITLEDTPSGTIWRR